jgi:hypothetical protein
MYYNEKKAKSRKCHAGRHRHRCSDYNSTSTCTCTCTGTLSPQYINKLGLLCTMYYVLCIVLYCIVYCIVLYCMLCGFALLCCFVHDLIIHHTAVPYILLYQYSTVLYRTTCNKKYTVQYCTFRVRYFISFFGQDLSTWGVVTGVQPSI